MVHIPLVSNNNGQLNCYMLLINDPSLAIQWPIGKVNWNMFSPVGAISTSLGWCLSLSFSCGRFFCHFCGEMIEFVYII